MKIPIVDENDNIIEFREREDRDFVVINRASALWITNNNGEILLAKRALSKIRNPGKWGPAIVGTVEENESYEENIIKESEEELGLKITHPILGPKIRIKTKWNYFVQIFLFTLDENISYFKFNELEVSGVQWIKKEELLKELQDNPTKFNASLPQYMKALYPDECKS